MGLVVKILILAFTLITGFLAYFGTRYRKLKEYDKTYSLVNNQYCWLLGLPAAPEDFVFFKDRYIISAVNNNIDYF